MSAARYSAWVPLRWSIIEGLGVNWHVDDLRVIECAAGRLAEYEFIEKADEGEATFGMKGDGVGAHLQRIKKAAEALDAALSATTANGRLAAQVVRPPSDLAALIERTEECINDCAREAATGGMTLQARRDLVQTFLQHWVWAGGDLDALAADKKNNFKGPTELGRLVEALQDIIEIALKDRLSFNDRTIQDDIREAAQNVSRK